MGAVKGVGSVLSATIVENRKDEDTSRDFDQRIDLRAANKKSIRESGLEDLICFRTTRTICM
jgi:DNA polymerase III alpha subunit